MFRGPVGVPSMMKEGASHYKGTEEAVLRNIDAAKKLYESVRTSFGPTGMCKLINNYIEKRYLTADASTILSELEVQHPAAKVLVMASQMQNSEFGDHTNYVVILAGELLVQAAELINSGVHQSFVTKGYELALQKTIEKLATLEACKMPKVSKQMLQPLVASKLSGAKSIEKLCELVEQACAIALPEQGERLNTDNVRVTKIVGGSFQNDSHVVNGMVLTREPKTDAQEKSNCKVVLLGTALESTKTEATSTVLIKTADDMLNFTKGEEAEMDELIKGYADCGVEVVLCGGAISSLALHFLNKYNILSVAIPSRFDLKRLSRTLRIPALQRRGVPMAEEIGLAEYVGVQEIGSQLVTVVRGKDTRVGTILLRGAAGTMMDEAERAIEDCVSLVAAVVKDDRFVHGAGSCEIELSEELVAYASTLSGLEQYAVKKFGEAFCVFPKLLADNSGHNALEAVTKLVAAHSNGQRKMGVDVTSRTGLIRPVDETVAVTESEDDFMAFAELGFPVFDHLLTKEWAIRLAVDAAQTLLRVDQIIMAKPAGGPKLPNQGHWDAADDREPNF